MNTTILYLIRHGQIENPKQLFYGRSVDLPLSDLGRSNIAKLGQALLKENPSISRLFTSPMRRTTETANILSNILNNIPVIKDDRLLEIYSKGFEGRSLDSIVKLGDVYAHPPEGVIVESPTDVINRLSSLIFEILNQFKGGSIGIVSHGDPLAFVNWDLTQKGMPLPEYTKLTGEKYLEKGTCWKLTFEDNKFLKEELIAPTS